MAKLAVIVNGESAGEVEQLEGGRLEFRYARSWQEHRHSYPLSLSMPLAKRVHGDAVIRPFMSGLLPDNDAVLERWARRFHVSARNPFALLTHMGEDCAGAVQFVPSDRTKDVRGSDELQVVWMSEDDIAQRLLDLVERQGTGRLPGDTGKFSLAGAQPKMALYYNGEQWGIPAGATPTTHILKPPAQPDLDGFDINEHFCLTLAEQLGLTAVRSRLKVFRNQQAIVVERYDRLWHEDGRVVRVHQEDTCQALGVPPWIKYENEGGPGAASIVDLLVDHSSEPDSDVGAFIDALVLNWVIAGTDAHAKNYSILIAPDSIRLALLYDLKSALPYPKSFPFREIKLAMRVDREYQLWKIRSRHWKGLATSCNLDPQPVLARVAELVADVPSAVERTAAALRAGGISHEVVGRLETTITERGHRCAELLEETR